MFKKKNKVTKSILASQETTEKYSFYSMVFGFSAFVVSLITMICWILVLLSLVVPTHLAADAKDSYLFPLDKPVKVHGRILCTSWYSKWRTEIIKGKTVSYQYKGFNYPAVYGSAIRAPFDGVVDSTNIGGYEGGTITLRATDGITTVRMCHVSNFEVLKYTTYVDSLTGAKWKEQTKVKRGDIIGYVGMSGRTTGSHVRIIFERNGERFFVASEIWGMKYTDFEYSKTEFDSAKTQLYKDIR